MRVAIVHHWFVTRGGGERVAECIASLFPKAEIFSLVADPAALPEGLRGRPLHTSFLQQIPFAKDFHRHMMPLYARATESLDLRGFDLVISSDSGPVKGVRIDPGAIHICYCHSPMRYLYDGYEPYREQMSGLTRAAFTATAGALRDWDTEAAQRVTHFIANSRYVADRIRRFYGRNSTVIHPPIDISRAESALAAVNPQEKPKHYLAAGRLVGYKRTDLLLQACIKLGRPLRIVGAGPDARKLSAIVQTEDKKGLSSFRGELSTEALWLEYASCRALLFAADEDFGMVPLEAQACGKPVIAYGAGGSLETIRGIGNLRSGVYFSQQTVKSVKEGILGYEEGERRGEFRPEVIREWASQFATPRFIREIRDFILEKVPAAGAEMT